MVYDTNPLINWKKRTLTFERDQRPLRLRLKPLNGKTVQPSAKREVRFYALILDRTPAQNDPEVSPTELPETLTPERFVNHHIDMLPGAKLFSRAPYRLSKFETDDFDKVVQEILSQGYIRPSTSPCAAPGLYKKAWDCIHARPLKTKEEAVGSAC
jgi:hypothetical protein